uniref:Uncharacterized protein n=1 Tax=Kalanchoe fedtschenkoi TaxID=63787 RepID=A0A7N0ZSP6_KALFE
MLDVARHERKKFAKKVFTGCGVLSRKCRLVMQAKKINQTIEGILKKKDTYGVRLDYGNRLDRAAQENSQNALNRRRRNIEEEDVVGFDQQACKVMEMVEPVGGWQAQELRVVSIVGMGGLGKTTLAKKIFNSVEIKKLFRSKVWVVISEHEEAKHVLKKILQYLDVDIEEDDDDHLKERLKERLDGRKYLIVLDDLWTPKQWEELKSYLPSDQKRGSRILLTTRIENVANVASTESTTYHLDPLGDAASWSLFCKKALKGEECPSNLEAIGKGIVSKCKGLPLAIVVLGGSLSAAESKPSFRYWSKILHDTSWHPDADNDCSKILLLSYLNLPPHLRACFLYVGVFPGDFEIVARELCLLWVAEGFVKGRSTELDENVAEQYLIDLADRNLVMISKRKSDGSIKSCRIHDLLRDLCLKEADKCDLYKVGADGASQNVKEGIRRLTLHKSDHITLLLHKRLRTLLDFANNSFSNIRSVSKDLSVLRLLHLHVRERDSSAPISIKNLILLKYLKVDNIGFGNLTELILIPYASKSSNLQVLNLKSNWTTYLPDGIWNLNLLRHIHVRPLATMPDARSSNDSLPYLQTLSCIVYQDHTSKMFGADRFPNLGNNYVGDRYRGSPTSPHLRKLFLHVDRDNPLSIESLHFLPKLIHLVALKIRCEHMDEGECSKPLNIVSFPSTLTKIRLKNTPLTSNIWRLLAELNNLQLQVLKLNTGKTDAISDEESFEKQPLVFEAKAFPQLLLLKLCTGHPDLILENGALRTLQYLIMHPRITNGYPGLSELPDRLWLSSTLKLVKVIDLCAPAGFYPKLGRF